MFENNEKTRKRLNYFGVPSSKVPLALRFTAAAATTTRRVRTESFAQMVQGTFGGRIATTAHQHDPVDLGCFEFIRTHKRTHTNGSDHVL